MKRKDGRELVTDYPVTAMDRIDYIPAGELPPIPESAIVCSPREPFADSLMMDEDPSSDDFDSWGA